LPILHWNFVVIAHLCLSYPSKGKDIMKQSKIFRENAENCAHLAESAANEPAFHRYKRMEAAWRALADEQDWLDGEVSPSRISSAHAGNGQAAANSGTSDSSA
jgi:hypothetical protein